MTIGALLDLGIDRDVFKKQLEELGLNGYELSIEKKKVNGITATNFKVNLTERGYHDHHQHVNLEYIEGIIDKSNLEKDIKVLSKKIFRYIAKAEKTVHDIPLEEIHFHEVGGIDSIIDIVGTAICISLLKPDHIYASPLHLGSGFVNCSHGSIPVPAPATLEILKGIPVYQTDVRGELVTPTGAAIIKAIASQFTPIPPMRIEGIGYGSGDNNYSIPNVLRVLKGKSQSITNYRHEELLLLETNIDDMNPEIYSFLSPLLFENGALDVYLTSIIMKKGRPATKLSVLCKFEDSGTLEDIIFKETTTLGIRRQNVVREILDRKSITVKTRLGRIKAKAIYRDANLLRISPEYEECKRIAEEKQLPLINVYELIQRDIQDYIFDINK